MKALAEPRWQILSHLIAHRQDSVSSIGKAIGHSQPNVSKHIQILREAGVVRSWRRGQAVMCEIIPALRRDLDDGHVLLDFGCCTFRFNSESSEGSSAPPLPDHAVPDRTEELVES